jgi:hypothetical protein
MVAAAAVSGEEEAVRMRRLRGIAGAAVGAASPAEASMPSQPAIAAAWANRAWEAMVPTSLQLQRGPNGL